jgi:hypothetical protein
MNTTVQAVPQEGEKLMGMDILLVDEKEQLALCRSPLGSEVLVTWAIGPSHAEVMAQEERARQERLVKVAGKGTAQTADYQRVNEHRGKSGKSWQDAIDKDVDYRD